MSGVWDGKGLGYVVKEGWEDVQVLLKHLQMEHEEFYYSSIIVLLPLPGGLFLEPEALVNAIDEKEMLASQPLNNLLMREPLKSHRHQLI